MKTSEAERLKAEGKTNVEIARILAKSPSWVGLALNPARLAKHRERARIASAKVTPEKRRECARRSYWNNVEANRARQRAYWGRNRDAKRQYAREYYRAYLDGDARRLVAAQMRAALWGWAHAKTEPVRRNGRFNMPELVGCEWATFRSHMEAQFTGAMSWGTYGVEWEIDHIRPLSSFNLGDREESRQAMHYTNCRPLPPAENRGRERRDDLMPARQSMGAEKHPKAKK